MAAGLFYALAAAFLWGAYLFGLKRYFDDYPGPVVIVLVDGLALCLYLPVSTAIGGVPDVPAFGVEAAVLVVAAIALAALGFLTFLRALSGGDVSLVAPVSKTVPVFVLPLEVLFFDEFFGPLQVAGIVVVTAGVYLANYRGGGVLTPLENLVSSRAVQFALASAACYAVSDLAKRVVLQDAGVPVRVWVPLQLGGIALLVLPLALRHWPSGVAADLPKFLVAAGVVALAQQTTAVTFAVTSASVASTVINLQAVVAVVLGGIVLGEEHLRTRLVAAALAVAGVGLIAL
ncbi:EamA family transporter [Halocalculus aciditolerans]|nr:DMT family transporter [Halocalculus aciditolerans]